MDLGLAGRKAIVNAASKGLGRSCAMALAAEGVEVLITARTKDELEATADDIRKSTGATVHALATDVTTAAGRAAILSAMPAPDILITNAGGPPPGDFRDFDEDAWRKAVENNMVTPLALIRATVYGMMDRGFGRIVNITSASVKAPISSLELSNGARAGLTGAVAALARNAIKRNVTINGLLPGLHETARMRSGLKFNAEKQGQDLGAFTAAAAARVPAGRFGTPDEFGAVCAFICSVHTGFMTGQNILLDGGSYPGTMG
jgi:3-oxoacyl-[acyl-carrier protein] reductase